MGENLDIPTRQLVLDLVNVCVQYEQSGTRGSDAGQSAYSEMRETLCGPREVGWRGWGERLVSEVTL